MAAADSAEALATFREHIDAFHKRDCPSTNRRSASTSSGSRVR